MMLLTQLTQYKRNRVTNLGASVVKDMINDDLEMFYHGKEAPNSAIIVTAVHISDITAYALCKFSAHVLKTVTAANYQHLSTDTVLGNSGEVLSIGENDLIVRLTYPTEAPQMFTIFLSRDKASLRVN